MGKTYIQIECIIIAKQQELFSVLARPVVRAHENNEGRIDDIHFELSLRRNDELKHKQIAKMSSLEIVTSLSAPAAIGPYS